MKLRLPDAAVFLIAAGVTVLCAVQVYGGRNGDFMLYVRGTAGTWVYPLKKTGTEQAEIPGLLGVTVVEISGGTARILSSPCANKTCMASGSVHRNGQWIACLPNAVVLSVEGAEPPGVPAGDCLDAAAW